ncbi:hypothetical protein PAENIP36_17990 [Paenibacillus sp. P36]
MVPAGYVPNFSAVFTVVKAPMLSCVPGWPTVSERLKPSVFPVNVIAPVALSVDLTTRAMIVTP